VPGRNITASSPGASLPAGAPAQARARVVSVLPSVTITGERFAEPGAISGVLPAVPAVDAPVGGYTPVDSATRARPAVSFGLTSTGIGSLAESDTGGTAI